MAGTKSHSYKVMFRWDSCERLLLLLARIWLVISYTRSDTNRVTLPYYHQLHDDAITPHCLEPSILGFYREGNCMNTITL